MKSPNKKVFFSFFALLIAGCADTGMWPNLGHSEPPPPAEEILISNEQFNKPYKILGPVEYTLKTRPTIFSSQIGIREQAIDLLKQQTYARFGDDVDAIIDTRVVENTINDSNGRLSITHIEGLAISFLGETTRLGKPAAKKSGRGKNKSAKKILIVNKGKATKKSTGKSGAEEIEITPEEILK
jgi:hypothetical protein